jgi:hypothetical protein
MQRHFKIVRTSALLYGLLKCLCGVNETCRSKPSSNITVFWDIAPCSMVEAFRRFRGAYCPDDGGSKYVRNVGKLLPVYALRRPRRRSSYSPPREHEVSQRFLCFLPPNNVWVIVTHSEAKIDHSTFLRGVSNLLYQSVYKTELIV